MCVCVCQPVCGGVCLPRAVSSLNAHSGRVSAANLLSCSLCLHTEWEAIMQLLCVPQQCSLCVSMCICVEAEIEI